MHPNRVKGKQFSVPELLGYDERFDALQKDSGCMLSIARLAPQVSGRENEIGAGADCSANAAVCGIQDYHRFHLPVEGVVQCIKDIDGEYYVSTARQG